jgi:hypothetical protein
MKHRPKAKSRTPKQPGWAANHTPEVTSRAETEAPEDAEDALGSNGRRPLTVALPDRLYRQVRLVASAEGTTVTSLVVEALEVALPTRLRAALDALGERSDRDS